MSTLKSVAAAEAVYEHLGKPAGDPRFMVEWSPGGSHPHVDPAVPNALKHVREGLHLRWNLKAVLVRQGYYEASGKLTQPEFEPRWELWDYDCHGAPYMICRIQTEDALFQPADERVVNLIKRQKRLIESFDGDASKAIEAQIDLANAAMEVMAEKDTKDFYEQVGKDIADYYTVKNIGYRGTRPLSGTGKMEDFL